MTQASVINCSAATRCGGVLFCTGGESRLVDCHIHGCHIMSAGGELDASGNVGGLDLWSGVLTMIRGSITGCSTLGEHGGAYLSGASTLYLIDVLVADCRSGGGGGIGVNGNLIMSGGAIRDCHALNGGNGGGLRVLGKVQLSGTTVQGCTASTSEGGGMWFSSANRQAQLNEVTVQDCSANEGGGMKISTGDVSLVDVSFEGCQASRGGAILQDADSILYANRVRVTKCNGFRPMNAGGGGTWGGAVALYGSSTWIDSIISDCTSAQSVIFLEGTHTFTRIAILRCRATIAQGGGLSLMGGGATTLLDSRIADTTAVSSGGCVTAGATAGLPVALVLRNTTLSNCSASEGPYVLVGNYVAFTSEMLTLETPCDEEHSGGLIFVRGTAPLQARDLKVHACASSRQILNDGMRLSRCSDDGDLCGAAATCTDVVPLLSAPNLTTVDCSCTGESFPSPAAASAALAPYGIDPSVDYCVTPRVASKTTLRGFVLEEVLRLSKTDTSNTVHTLELEIDMDGTDDAPAAWTINANSVPFWLSLPLQGNIGATNQTSSLQLMANTSGLPERLAAPNEALLNISVTSQRDKTFLVLVKLYVSAPAIAGSSIWGRPSSERVCYRDAQGHGTHTEVVLGETVNTPFTACDVDGLATEHDLIGSFKALLIDQSSGALHSLSIASELPGTYLIAIQVPHLGEFGLRLTFTATDGTTEQVGVERVVRAVCPAAKEPLLNGLDCGCQRGTVFNVEDAACEACPVARYYSFAQWNSEATCLSCPTDATTERMGSVAIESCVCNKGFFIGQTDGLVHGEGDCVPCPPGTACDTIGLQVQELPLKTGWWRVSNTSFDVKRCEDYSDDAGSGCVGGPNAQACKDSLAGPLCVLCKHGVGHYYNQDLNDCLECGAGTKYVTLVVVACIGIGLSIGSAILMHYCSLPVAKACKPKRRVLLKVWVAVRSLMVKAKIAWSFYQV